MKKGSVDKEKGKRGDEEKSNCGNGEMWKEGKRG
jgi:hypothetical protein